MFERYYGEGSKVVPRSSLSTITRRNLGYLEQERGCRFGDYATMAQFGWRPSYIIEGEGPNGEEVVFERRETGNPKGGQTYIWIDGKKTRLVEIGGWPKPVRAFEGSIKTDIKGFKRKGLEGLVDTEGASEVEKYNLDNLLTEFAGALTEEEKKQIKEQVKEYRKGLRKYEA